MMMMPHQGFAERPSFQQGSALGGGFMGLGATHPLSLLMSHAHNPMMNSIMGGIMGGMGGMGGMAGSMGQSMVPGMNGQMNPQVYGANPNVNTNQNTMTMQPHNMLPFMGGMHGGGFGQSLGRAFMGGMPAMMF